MSRIVPKKERVKLNDTLNNKLDSMEDTSALDVFKPKQDMSSLFRSMTDEVMDDNLKVGYSKNKSIIQKIGKVLCICIIIFAFITFLYFMWQFFMI